jgi:hypothetical protein
VNLFGIMEKAMDEHGFIDGKNPSASFIEN